MGLARTLLALGTAITLIATDPKFLMAPLSDGVTPPVCVGMTQAGIWCLIPQLWVARWISVLILLVAASGWRPRFTALPQWRVSWSLFVNVTMVDGGGQITAILTGLLVVISVTDSRRWHWQTVGPVATPTFRHGTARITLLVIQLQVAVLYFQSSVAKLGVPEWADGTAMYYWSRDPQFGSGPWLRPVTELITHSPVGVALMSWGPIALEFAIALGLLLRPAIRRVLLAVGIIFHVSIALDMGLVSFGIAMCAALLLDLLPVGHQLQWPQRLWQRVKNGRTPEAAAQPESSAGRIGTLLPSTTSSSARTTDS